MTILKASSMTHFDMLLDLLEEYHEELRSICSAIAPLSRQELQKEYFYSPDLEFMFAIQKNDIIGFVITSNNNILHEKADIEIVEFYVCPKWRNKGYGTKMANKTIKDAKSVCLDILNENTSAKRFWEKILKNWKENTKLRKQDEMATTKLYTKQ